MTKFDGPPLEERHTSDEDLPRRTYLDGVRDSISVINGVLYGRQAGLAIELTTPVEADADKIAEEREKLAMRAGEISLATEIRISMTLLYAEAQLADE